MSKLTGPIARAEIARRANNRAHKGETDFVREDAGPEVTAYVAKHGPITGAQLSTWAGKGTPTPAPVKAAAKVSKRTAAQVAATALRNQAWEMRNAGEGTYAECLALIGGTPANAK